MLYQTLGFRTRLLIHGRYNAVYATEPNKGNIERHLVDFASEIHTNGPTRVQRALEMHHMTIRDKGFLINLSIRAEGIKGSFN